MVLLGNVGGGVTGCVMKHRNGATRASRSASVMGRGSLFAGWEDASHRGRVKSEGMVGSGRGRRICGMGIGAVVGTVTTGRPGTGHSHAMTIFVAVYYLLLQLL